MELADLIDFILDETTENELVISFKRERNKISATIKDNLSDIGYALENDTSAALEEMKNQMQSFMDEQTARR